MKITLVLHLHEQLDAAAVRWLVERAFVHDRFWRPPLAREASPAPRVEIVEIAP